MDVMRDVKVTKANMIVGKKLLIFSIVKLGLIFRIVSTKESNFIQATVHPKRNKTSPKPAFTI